VPVKPPAVRSTNIAIEFEDTKHLVIFAGEFSSSLSQVIDFANETVACDKPSDLAAVDHFTACREDFIRILVQRRILQAAKELDASVVLLGDSATCLAMNTVRGTLAGKHAQVLVDNISSNQIVGYPNAVRYVQNSISFVMGE
jgi:hypothetical protein